MQDPCDCSIFPLRESVYPNGWEEAKGSPGGAKAVMEEGKNNSNSQMNFSTPHLFPLKLYWVGTAVPRSHLSRPALHPVL